MCADWMSTGLDDADFAGDPSAGGSGLQRFWMPKGANKKIGFLTKGKDAAIIWEHQVKLNGNWRNWVPCVEPLGETCALCQWAEENNEFKRYKGCYFIVVDMTPFEDKQGNKRVNERRLLCAKKDTAELIKRRYMDRLEEGEDLRGATFKVYRSSSDKSPSVGDDYQFGGMIDLDDLPDTEHPDWSEILKPDPERAKAVVAQLRRGRGMPDESGKSEGPSDDHKVSY